MDQEQDRFYLYKAPHSLQVKQSLVVILLDSTGSMNLHFESARAACQTIFPQDFSSKLCYQFADQLYDFNGIFQDKNKGDFDNVFLSLFQILMNKYQNEEYITITFISDGKEDFNLNKLLPSINMLKKQKKLIQFFMIAVGIQFPQEISNKLHAILHQGQKNLQSTFKIMDQSDFGDCQDQNILQQNRKQCYNQFIDAFNQIKKMSIIEILTYKIDNIVYRTLLEEDEGANIINSGECFITKQQELPKIDQQIIKPSTNLEDFYNIYLGSIQELVLQSFTNENPSQNINKFKNLETKAIKLQATNYNNQHLISSTQETILNIYKIYNLNEQLKNEDYWQTLQTSESKINLQTNITQRITNFEPKDVMLAIQKINYNIFLQQCQPIKIEFINNNSEEQKPIQQQVNKTKNQKLNTQQFQQKNASQQFLLLVENQLSINQIQPLIIQQLMNQFKLFSPKIIEWNNKQSLNFENILEHLFQEIQNNEFKFKNFVLCFIIHENQKIDYKMKLLNQLLLKYSDLSIQAIFLIVGDKNNFQDLYILEKVLSIHQKNKNQSIQIIHQIKQGQENNLKEQIKYVHNNLVNFLNNNQTHNTQQKSGCMIKGTCTPIQKHILFTFNSKVQQWLSQCYIQGNFYQFKQQQILEIKEYIFKYYQLFPSNILIILFDIIMMINNMNYINKENQKLNKSNYIQLDQIQVKLLSLQFNQELKQEIESNDFILNQFISMEKNLIEKNQKKSKNNNSLITFSSLLIGVSAVFVIIYFHQLKK